MPEKPEVITVSKALEKKILNKNITDVQIYWDNIIAKPETDVFKKKIREENIKKITTRGKFIVIELSNYYLLIHLRMEGKFTFRKKGEERNKHEHIIFALDDEIELRYHDVRKFGKMYLVEKEKLYTDTPLKDLGLEFDSPALTSKYLLDKFKSKNKYIKTVLLDQSIIAGIGNIYDDEILFRSGINPYKKAKELNEKDCDRLVQNTRIILKKAINLGGTTIKSFTSEEGIHGRFQNELLVHGKKKEECPNCHSQIKKEQIDGRGTYFCEICQK